MDKDGRSNVIRDIEYQLRKLDNIYNIDSMEDDSEPEAGAFDKLRGLLNKKQR